MGGMAALAYMARPPAHRPADPAGLLLVATAAGRLCERGLGRLLATPITRALYHLVARAPEHLVRTLAGPVCATVARYAHCGRDERATLAALATNAITDTPLSTAVGYLPGLQRYDAYAVLKTIAAHTVVVSGDDDLLTPPAHAHDLAAISPAANTSSCRRRAHAAHRGLPRSQRRASAVPAAHRQPASQRLGCDACEEPPDPTAPPRLPHHPEGRSTMTTILVTETPPSLDADLQAGLRWLYATAQPPGAVVERRGAKITTAERSLRFVPISASGNPLIVVDLLDVHWAVGGLSPPVAHNGRDSCDYWCGVSSPVGPSSAACFHLARISAWNQTRISASVNQASTTTDRIGVLHTSRHG